MKGLHNCSKQFWQVCEGVFNSSIYATLAVIFEMYMVRDNIHTSRVFVVCFGVFAFFTILILRYVIKVCLDKTSMLKTPLLIIGAGKTAELFVQGLEAEKGLGYEIIGFLEDNEVTIERLKKYPVLGCFDEAEEIIAKTGVQHVVIAAPGTEQQKLIALFYKVQNLVKNVGFIPGFIGIPLGGIEVETFFTQKIMVLNIKNNLMRPLNRFVKTIFDYILTFFGTIAISPILLVIAAWIYKDSPGPVVFKHIRIGKNGKPFPCYKFRSMCVDAKEKLEELLENDPAAREEWERDFKLKNDPRITKSGAFLRKTSLDELPQIFNVLRGEMSLVGPRPIVEAELVKYGELVEDYLSVKPGITGMWQVSGRSDTTYEERVQMDSWYVRNWSVWLDIMLLWRTFKSVIKQKGAY